MSAHASTKLAQPQMKAPLKDIFNEVGVRFIQGTVWRISNGRE